MGQQDPHTDPRFEPHATVPVDDLLDSLWRLDMDLRIIYASPATDSLLGIPAAALLGSPLADYTTATELAQFRETMAGVLAGTDRTRRFLLTISMRHADGHQVPCEVHGRLVLDNTGEPEGMVCNLRDITERVRSVQAERQAELRRFELQKMGAIAQLAGGIIGDLEGLLQALDRCPETEDHPELRPVRDQAAQRVVQLRTLAGQLDLEYSDVDIDALIAGLVADLKTELPGNITLIHQRGSGGSTVWADSAQLDEVLRNLCLNARDAMPLGGVITISTGLREAEPAAEGPPAAAPRPWVTITVNDTGQGLDPATRERILEPFFTTKAEARGLSLPLAHGIVNQHDGRLEVESTLGQGSSFRVVLPARFAGVVSQAANENAMGRPTVLLVDDDPEILRYCGKILRSGGFQVQACADGVEALAYIAGEDPVDLVVLDWALPGLEGRRVREQLSRRLPRLPLLIISGHLREEYEALGGIDPDTPWLVKPFTPTALLAAVRALLPARGPGS
jgi:two-component system, cell cycle sensor histidine kinase and response regulator CckA